MRATQPHFLLYSTVAGQPGDSHHWRFVLQPVGSDACLAVADAEANAHTSRLELLAVVRGLEALDQPSRVTLLTGSRYVIRGIRRGLNQWRERRWRWERFGQLVPIRDDDLWQRVDRALEFHDVQCCEWRSELEPPAAAPAPETLAVSTSVDELVLPEPASARSEEPVLVIVPRTVSRRSVPRAASFWPFAALREWFRRGLSPQITSIGRPAFTRAA